MGKKTKREQEHKLALIIRVVCASQSPSPASGDSDNRTEQMSTLFF